MARPRVFVSSAFYDLQQIRADLETFIRDIGYEPVLHERGAVAYGKEEKLEEYCYKEVQNVDILVSVVGGRFGSNSQQQPYSVSQVELKTALKHGKQVYIFVDRAVAGEYRTYQANKGKKDAISWIAVDNVKIYEFLNEIHALPNNNQIQSFDSAQDIVRHLWEQWAGLFQRFLQEQEQRKPTAVLERMENVLGTLGKLVDVLSTEKAIATETVSTIIKLSHPLCRRVKCNLGLTFPVYFTTVGKLDGLLLQLGYKQLSPDVPPYGSAKGRENGRPQRDRLVWVNDEGDKLTLDAKLFNSDGVLHDMTERDWQEDYLEYAVAERFIPADDEDSQGDIPF